MNLRGQVVVIQEQVHYIAVTDCDMFEYIIYVVMLPEVIQP